MDVIRFVTRLFVATILCATVAACDSDTQTASPPDGAPDPTNESAVTAEDTATTSPAPANISINNHQEYAAWDDRVIAKCSGLQAFTAELQKCLADALVGTTVTLDGPVLTRYTTGDVVALNVGSDNPRLQPWPSVPPTYAQDFVCVISVVADCGTVAQGDRVTLRATYQLSENPTAGLVAAELFIESVVVE